jgi:hypothetical protein
MFGHRFERCVCADGFSMSVQAHNGAYCRPRVDGASRYESVEVGFPSEPETILMEWAEDSDRPTDTVYGWVPVAVIRQVIEKHGGMVDGEVPPGV